MFFDNTNNYGRPNQSGLFLFLAAASLLSLCGQLLPEIYMEYHFIKERKTKTKVS